jgi:4'-phosphopantetheinyl transferase
LIDLNDAIYVYYADRRAVSDEAIAALVTAADRERLTPTMVERRRSEYLAGRALLRYAVAERTGRAASALRIEVTANGKPAVPGGPEVSLSHSGDIVVCAVASVAVGIDVEVAPPRDIEAVAERYFTEAENRWLEGADPQRFRMLWVLKEAYLKALGIGLAGGLGSLECRIEPPTIAARCADGSAPPQLRLFSCNEAYVGLAALDAQRPFNVVLREFPAAAAMRNPLRALASTE